MAASPSDMLCSRIDAARGLDRSPDRRLTRRIPASWAMVAADNGRVRGVLWPRSARPRDEAITKGERQPGARVRKVTRQALLRWINQHARPIRVAYRKPDTR